VAVRDRIRDSIAEKVKARMSTIEKRSNHNRRGEKSRKGKELQHLKKDNKLGPLRTVLCPSTCKKPRPQDYTKKVGGASPGGKVEKKVSHRGRGRPREKKACAGEGDIRAEILRKSEESIISRTEIAQGKETLDTIPKKKKDGTESHLAE